MAKDTYSLLLVSDIWTFQFVFSVGVFLFQVLIYSFLIDGFLSEFEESNVPANVSYAVKALQFVALVITLLTEDDPVYALVSASIFLDPAEK